VTSAQILVANLVVILLGGTLVGMVWNRRLSACWSFTALLIVAMVTNRLVAWWPATFYTRQFWTAKELALSAIEALVAIELCVVTLRAFPRARRLAIVAVTCVVVVAGLVIVGSSTPDYYAVVGIRMARAQVGIAWAYATFIAVVWWFRLPLGQFEARIVLGFALYLSAYGSLLSVLGWLGWRFYPYVAALDPAASAATIGLWLLAAWQPEAFPARRAIATARP